MNLLFKNPPMIETEEFDVVIEGTDFLCFLEFLNVKNTNKIAFVDDSEFCGTSFTTKQLKKSISKFINELVIRKNTNKDVILEILPILINKDNKLIEIVENSAFSESIDYVKIKDFYFICQNRDIFKIPYTSTDIYENEWFLNTFNDPKDDKMNLNDVYLYSKALKNNNLKIFLDNTKNKESILYKLGLHGIIDTNLYNNNLKYPQYGLGSIAEYLSLHYSMQGIVFCVNKNLRKDCNNKISYKLEDAELVAKNIIKPDYQHGKVFIRVIMCEMNKLKGNFKAFLECDEILTVLGFNNLTQCCPCGYQLLYFIKQKKHVTDEDIKIFKIDLEKVELDISYEICLNLFEYDKIINE